MGTINNFGYVSESTCISLKIKTKFFCSRVKNRSWGPLRFRIQPVPLKCARYMFLYKKHANTVLSYFRSNVQTNNHIPSKFASNMNFG